MNLKEIAAQVDARLEALLPSAEIRPSSLNRAMRYACLAPGKRLRPALCLLSAEAVGGERLAALDPACAVEMIHAFSLIHDDLPAIDNDDLRRGRPTTHIAFGEAVAILAGDALFALALQTLSRTPATPERVVRGMRILSDATAMLVGGETVDVESEGAPVDAETLAYIHSHKTGALIAAACELGGVFGGGRPEDCQALQRYGASLGLAFQIVDDLLNETSTAEVLGKAAGSDRERQKATYPALYGIEGSRQAAQAAAEDAVRALDGLAQPDVLAAIAWQSLERAA